MSVWGNALPAWMGLIGLLLILFVFVPLALRFFVPQYVARGAGYKRGLKRWQRIRLGIALMATLVVLVQVVRIAFLTAKPKSGVDRSYIDTNIDRYRLSE